MNSSDRSSNFARSRSIRRKFCPDVSSATTIPSSISLLKKRWKALSGRIPMDKKIPPSTNVQIVDRSSGREACSIEPRKSSMLLESGV